MPPNEIRRSTTGEEDRRSHSVPAATDRERRPLAERFESFHEANPHVYRTLVRLAREWVAKTGRDRVGIAALFERARWELSLATSETSPALNNDYRSFYARLIMSQEADLAELFTTRRSTADKEFGVVRWPGQDGPRLDRGEGKLW